MERVPESIANAIKGTIWMKVVAFLGIAGGTLVVIGGVLGMIGSLRSLIAFVPLEVAFGIIILVISVIALIVGAFFIYTYRMLWYAVNYLEESYTSLSALVRAINYLDRFFTFQTVFLIIIFAISVLRFITSLAAGMGSAVIERYNSAKMMRILAVLTVLSAFISTVGSMGNDIDTPNILLATTPSLLIFGPMAFFLWRAASFREKIEGEINETNAEYVAGYLTNLRWYFMLQVILAILSMIFTVVDLIFMAAYGRA